MKTRFIIIFIILINIKCSFNDKGAFRRNIEGKVIPKKVKENPLKRRNFSFKRQLESENLNITLEYKNIEREIELYNLIEYRDILFNAMNKSAETLSSLLKPTERMLYF